MTNVIIIKDNGDCPFLLRFLYLRKGPRSFPDHPDNAQWDTHHGGHSHEPADSVAPVRIDVHVVVLQRLVFNQEEQENSLHQKETHCLQIMVKTWF